MMDTNDMKIVSKKIKFVGDMALNLVASAIPIIVLQLIILPTLAKDINADRYGLLVTILALLNVVPSSFGNVMNNVRLLYDKAYKEKQYEGDFRICIFVFEAISLIIVVVTCFLYDPNISFVDMIATLILAALWLAREYYIVAFRLSIDFKAILVNNILLTVGYIAGVGIYQVFNQWQIIYLSGYIFSMIYIMRKSTLWKEPIRITPMFRFTSTQSIMLLISALLLRLMNYSDKLLLYPVLGGATVSVYYAATVFGKVISLMVTPVASVFLTYLAGSGDKDNKTFKYTASFGFVICAVGYVFCVVASRPVLKLIYPQFVDEAMKYIYVTTITAVLTAYAALINPFIMKYFKMNWQIVINGVTVILYIFIGLVLLKTNGLMGFCIGTVISNTIKVLIMFVVYFKSKRLSFENI